jgi:hypothetical protein
MVAGQGTKINRALTRRKNLLTVNRRFEELGNCDFK